MTDQSFTIWLSQPVVLSFGLGLILAIYYAYIKALPKPIPGIPYNSESASRLLGDIPHLLALERAGKRPRQFWASVCRRHKSPIAQWFPGPFKKSCVILSDYRESRDLLARRAKQVERASFSRSMWSGALPGHFIGLSSKDPVYHMSKTMSRDLMTPSFLHEVSIPASYEKTLHFIELWKTRAAIANGRPFDALLDLDYLTSDIISAAALGINDDESDVVKIKESLKTADISPSLDSADNDKAFSFPITKPEGLLHCTLNLAEAVGGAPTSPNMRIYWYLTNLRPSVRRAKATREKILREHIQRACQRASEGASYRAAVDFIVSRELAAAKKEGRSPLLDSSLMLDTLSGYIIGGQDTTHSVVSFLVKYLGTYQKAQSKLRDLLHSTYLEARAMNRMPTVREIISTQIPYLDAILEEVMRLESGTPAIITETVEDITLLGHLVPTGTHVFCTLSGPSVTEPALPVGETLRSQTSQDHIEETPTDWTSSGFEPEAFHPERWLRIEDGREIFDIKAGPTLSFGAGPRECWGRRLAYLELRLITTLLVWNFDFLPLPKELDDTAAVDILNAKPKTCFVRLRDRN